MHFLVAPHVGGFVRVLLPVRLTGGYHVTYGTWLGLGDEETYQRAWSLWEDPRYPSLVIEGRIANAIEPWGPPLMALARAAVKSANEVPYIDVIRSPRVAEVLTETWPRDWVLSAVPSSAWHNHEVD